MEGKFPFKKAGKLALASGQSEGRSLTLQDGGQSVGDAWPLLLALSGNSLRELGSSPSFAV